VVEVQEKMEDTSVHLFDYHRKINFISTNYAAPNVI